MGPTWGVDAEELVEQQANWPAQDSDSEEDDPAEDNHDGEPDEVSGFYCDSSDFWA